VKKAMPTNVPFEQATRSVPHFVKLSSADQIQLLQNIVMAMGGKKAIDVGQCTITLSLPYNK
jgi:hypothetical protein